ncbi:MAG: hypothetical protein ACREL5_15135, partial [Gemmatimonadales bacterium]
MIVPTRRWYLVAALLAALAPLALVVPSAATIWFAADMAWVLAFVIDALRVGNIAIGEFPVTRLPPPAFSVGRPMPVSYRWSNPAARPLVIRVRERVVPMLAMHAGREREVRLPAGTEMTETQTFEPVRRGKASAGTLFLRIRGPMGLVWR